MHRRWIYTFFSLLPIFAHADRLCYSTVSRSVQNGVRNQGVSLSATPRATRHTLALEASTLIYELADLETVTGGEEFLAKHARFESRVPSGYRFEYYFANRASGLKYAILAPNTPTDPWIFAFAGTQTAIDWMTDVNLGRAQFANVEGLLYQLTNCEYQDGTGFSTAGRDWIVTGHSLGGGLAEIFAYSAQKRRLQQGLSPMDLELVTFNAFGALDVVKDSPRAAAPVVSTFLSANYFVTGDVVSRIGTHIGNTYELELPRASLLKAANRHFIETVWKTAIADGVPRFDSAPQRPPPAASILNALKDHMSFFSFLPANQSESVTARLAHLNTLEQALNIILRRRRSGEYDREALRLINGMSLIFLRDEQARASTGFRDEVILRLQKLLSASSAAMKG